MEAFALLLTVCSLLPVFRGTDQGRVETTETEQTKCCQNVTLWCNLTSVEQNLMVIEMSWNKDGMLCNNTNNISRNCSYTVNQGLALNLKVNSSDSGTYTCKLQTNFGHSLNRTYLNVSDCTSNPCNSSSRHEWTRWTLSLTVIFTFLNL